MMTEEQAFVEIPLSRGLVTKVDAQDADWIGRWKWAARDNGSGLLYVSRTRRVDEQPGPRSIYLHRLLLGVPAGRLTDHINGDTLDNRRINLRVASSAENARNRGIQRNNTSGLSGVHRLATTGLWTAFISVDGRRVHLGSFASPEDACRARRAAEREHYREFARGPAEAA